MILVLLGTCRHGFDRRGRAMEEYARQSGEEIRIQLGRTSYRPAGVAGFDFLPREDLLRMIERADLVICHGGFATLSDCLRLRKKIVAVPRRRDLGETLDSGLGQEEIVRELERLGKIIGVYDIRTLPQAVERARLSPVPGAASSEIPDLIGRYVKSLFA